MDRPPPFIPDTAVAEARAVDKLYGDSTSASGVAALQGVSLSVQAGEFVALVGRSGCGKTTLLNLLGGMDTPTRGAIWLAGQPTALLSDSELTRLRRGAVGFVFQFFNLLPTLSVQENVELPLLLQGELALAAVRRRAREVLQAVGLAERAADYPHRLSGGQMQRVALARAVVHRPRLIVADEPTGNLDTTSADQVLALLRGLCTDQHTAIVMATHSPEAAAIADRVVRLRDGRIVAGHGDGAGDGPP